MKFFYKNFYFLSIFFLLATLLIGGINNIRFPNGKLKIFLCSTLFLSFLLKSIGSKSAHKFQHPIITIISLTTILITLITFELYSRELYWTTKVLLAACIAVQFWLIVFGLRLTKDNLYLTLETLTIGFLFLIIIIYTAYPDVIVDNLVLIALVLLRVLLYFLGKYTWLINNSHLKKLLKGGVLYFIIAIVGLLACSLFLYFDSSNLSDNTSIFVLYNLILGAFFHFPKFIDAKKNNPLQSN